MNEKRTIKCSICGRTRVILDSELAEIMENNYLRMCKGCEEKAKSNELPYPYVIEDQGHIRDYINKIRGIESETE